MDGEVCEEEGDEDVGGEDDDAEVEVGDVGFGGLLDDVEMPVVLEGAQVAAPAPVGGNEGGVSST